MSFGATILDADGLRLSGEERAFFRDADPFGFILFARNIDSAGQIRALCGDFRETVGRDCPILIDQEGGRVQRLRAPLGREWLPPLDHVTRAGEGAERAMYLRYRLIADELRGLGIDTDCAPMADLAFEQTHTFLKNRCYGGDPATVAGLARAVADGLLDGGVLPVLKHIPGHGRATQDSHFDLPHVAADAETLDGTDFEAFRALNDLPMGMTAHLVYDAIDGAAATLSAPVMRLIRERIGFQGLIMTDDISMRALKGDLGTLSRAALAAGCDVVLHCNGTLAERIAVAEASGTMGAAAQARAEAALAARRAPGTLDIRAAEEELSALMGGEVYGG
ncbi:glycoside hydrolase family 3 N-terminal domain-containing protein [Antarcticimicrobium luteum]|uniref:beta-N-acetylhexosaminidase n=1 Tax=Antarcticimicrobium luteum TaxID=2547397 RepID=A0A4R5VI10_9RHOB|nr:glycoside hydrolase family 3 N-terminal domain-containing protein [Antarcticimicrobium luteum]TDK51959.1 glycoside hydrolase family 3 protein [Antarcticimicrobium luteum]